ncbi:MaoC family dehydratase [Paracoccaceae bacterium]|nr:MaoC family dehydratase [Paracoccaceae bacterium]
MKNIIEKGTICVEDLEIGMSRMLERKITQNDIILFSKVSGDENPVHLDEDYAQQTIFGRRIAHGILTASLISAVIAEHLPGHGTVYLSQTLKFIRPVLPNQLVTTTVLVTHIEYSKRHVTLDCKCKVDEKIVLAGEALVLAPSRKFD